MSKFNMINFKDDEVEMLRYLVQREMDRLAPHSVHQPDLKIIWQKLDEEVEKRFAHNHKGRPIWDPNYGQD